MFCYKSGPAKRDSCLYIWVLFLTFYPTPLVSLSIQVPVSHHFNYRGFRTLWSRKWQPIPVFLPGKFHGQRSLVGYSPWGHKESDPTEGLTTTTKIPFYRSRRASASPTLPGLFPGAPSTLLCSSSQSLLLSLRHSYSTVFAFTYCLSLAFSLLF